MIPSLMLDVQLAARFVPVMHPDPAWLCTRERVPLYFRVPPGLAVASAIGRWPGIDIRAPGYRTGGYLAGPGSVVGGAAYVIEHDVPGRSLPRSLPRWLAGLLTRPHAGFVTPAPTSASWPRRSRNTRPPVARG
jgi:hypothetical protein